ncbi:MAG: hypothetical protein IJ572_00830 [Bacilli bacterium]|nr:hypothetical protein [Bacilli bacterium]
MKRILKSRLLFFILGAVIFSTVSVFAYSILATNVGFTPTESTWNVDNVSDALNNLYNEVHDMKKGTFEFVDTDTYHPTYTIDVGFKPSFVYLYIERNYGVTTWVSRFNNKLLAYDSAGNRGESYVTLNLTDTGFTFRNVWWGNNTGLTYTMNYVAVK